MKTTHKIFFKSSQNMRVIPDSSVHLVVTSPPYPMIEMWDDLFVRQNKAILKALKYSDGTKAFELMHQTLDQVWQELHRILINGGIACINIGDATRTVGDNFSLYANHARILNSLVNIGFSALPLIIWRKPTNAPNKFMGSGMLPGGAYVTLEHEYVLIVRKGPKREFNSAPEKQTRRESALFWEERNHWFSDVWFGLIGTRQKLKKNATRLRSGAFPFELAYRLVNMYSAKGDTVVDPFLGTGTTMWSAMASGRNCVGFEIETGFQDVIGANQAWVMAASNDCIRQRIDDHLAYVESRLADKGKFKYINRHYRFPVMTRQEVELFINPLQSVEQSAGNRFEVAYANTPDRQFEGDWKTLIPDGPQRAQSGQLQLF
jgi:DNA modification methylase